MMTGFELLGLLVVGHALADYPLQGTWIATTKSHRDPHPSGYPWYQSLTAHSVIHGGFVGIITVSFALGLAETVAHWVIDFLKNDTRFDVNTDQFLHVWCKVLWAVIWVLSQ